MVIGGHGDTTMIPLTRLASYNGIKISELLDENKLAKVAADTMVEEKINRNVRNLAGMHLELQFHI